MNSSLDAAVNGSKDQHELLVCGILIAGGIGKLGLKRRGPSIKQGGVKIEAEARAAEGLHLREPQHSQQILYLPPHHQQIHLR
jgi:hypothetical protein